MFVIYIVNSLEWNPLVSEGDSAANLKYYLTNTPYGRENGTLNYYKNALYLLGGNDDLGNFSDFWRYDLNENTWISLENNEFTDDGISKHKSVIYGDYLIVFGGMLDNPWNSNKNALLSFNVEDGLHHWTRIYCNISSKRINHSMSIINDKLIIVGGFTGLKYPYKDGMPFNDIYYINAENIVSNTNQNNEIKFIKIDIPLPDISSHFSCVNNNEIILFTKNPSNELFRINMDFIFYSSKILYLIHGYIKQTFTKHIINDIAILISKFTHINYERKKLIYIQENKFFGGCVYIKNLQRNIFLFNGDLNSFTINLNKI